MDTPGAGVAPDRAPDWYPDRANPNVQNYWDGAAWTARRRWVGGRWHAEQHPDAPVLAAEPGASMQPGVGTAPPPPPGAAYNRYQSAPYPNRFVPGDPARTAAPIRETSFSAGGIGLIVCSFLLILGSFTPWVTSSFGPLHGSVAGTDSGISLLIGVNGWITFAGGLLLFLLACLAAIATEPVFRSLALIIALVVAGFAVYDLVRIVQKVLQASHPAIGGVSIPTTGTNGFSVGVGWGLIVVVIGALGALAAAWSQARSS